MATLILARSLDRQWPGISYALLLALLLCLAGCTSGGGEGQATAPSAPSPQVERQAIDNLIKVYAIRPGDNMLFLTDPLLDRRVVAEL